MSKNKPNVTITEEQKRAIDSYSNQIVTLKDTVTAIRKLPGMYCAGKGDIGFLSLFREIYQNAVDQVIDPNTPANFIEVYYNEITKEVIVSDNGFGFPFNDMVRMVTAQHTSKNYNKVKGQYSSGLHGSGLKVVNALSTECTIESYKYDGTAKRIDLVEGYLKKGPYDIKNKECKQGSTVRFIPSIEVLGELTLSWGVVYTLVKRILSLTPIGSEVFFSAVDINGVQHNEHIVNKDGIITEFIGTVNNPMCKPIIIGDDNGEFKIDLALIYDGGTENDPPLSEEITTAFCNMCPTVKGDHIDGVVDGICRWFMTYMNNIFLANQKAKVKTKVNSSDIRTGLNVMISGFCLEPVFVGQAKEQLNVPEMAAFVKRVVMTGLDEWSKSNPADLTRLCKYFKDIADARMKMDKEKIKIVTSYQQNSLTGLPRKYAKPTEREEEFIIVEGDSAGGTAKVGRDKTCQGIFPIRGKIPSAYDTTKQRFWENPETQGIARIILGREYTKNFKVEDIKWKKIIIMADADVDGSHIASLILRFFILYMPQVVRAGLVYKALPPLYGVVNGKKITYFTDQLDFVRFVQKIFISSNKLADVKTKTNIPGKDITVLFMNNEDYVYEMERLADTYGVDPRLLELALFEYLSGTSLANIKKELKKKFRFMDVEVKNKCVVYNGTIAESNFLFVNDKLLKDCERIINIIKKNDKFYYLLNDQVSSLYDIMKAFDKSTPSNIQRYKGLGEMNADKLAVSTLRPDSDRTLVRYTLEDMKEELAAIREYESDRSKLLDFVGTVRRVDLLD